MTSLDLRMGQGELGRPETARPATARPRAHRSERTRGIILLTLAFWVSNFVLLSLGTALTGNPHLPGIMGMRALAMLFGLSLCALIHWVLNRPKLSSWRRRVIVLAILAPICAESFAWLIFFFEMVADPVTVSLANFTWAGAVRTIAFWTWFFLAWAGLYLAWSYSWDVQEEQQRSAELQAQAHAAQLRALHSQINPHFLFNSLNSVSALILDGEAARADAMVSRLSQFLRMGLSIDATAVIPLVSEIALQRAYLEIEQVRYPDLEVVVEVPAALDDALVPSLILQPIVENAVKYGVAGSPPPSRIAIKVSEIDARRMAIEVTDSGKGNQVATNGAPHGHGIGLANVAERLRLLYGEAHRMEKGYVLGKAGWRVRIELPVERA